MQDQLIEAALAAARKCLATRFKGASHLFVAGSILRGDGNAFSDIDMVILYPRLERAWRESFVLDGFPVEAFVQDPETLAYFFENDAERGVPVIIDMVSNGVILGDAPDEAATLQQRARQILAAGPKPLAGAPLDALRYILTDLADDLRAERPADEIAATAAQLYPRLIDLMLLGRNHWTGNGKWGPRLLRRLDPALASLTADAFRDAVQGNPAALLSLTDRELTRHGGPCFDGYRSDAAESARLPSSAKADDPAQAAP
ncbi:nucleotidyltransferase domain-containing protein [Pleomorphomonas sp. NRK KF1]|uniref:nucleotidyltransferase domain-containing protein n=1 Tax=Pleomorphomonas sp. NRK KF1 TaxID=2943000 RepID=UPI0020434CB4|nr:nucleotidyltransferase domain-containing protein [Pleomorphomonas sp. NRK KF1]MCM5554178.1 nucleotidyltransferase domain-containing protein [Pleomorphomonas sp. NRK KF1]